MKKDPIPKIIIASVLVTAAVADGPSSKRQVKDVARIGAE